MCCEKLLGRGGSVQVRGWWVPRWMTRMEAEAEGGLLVAAAGGWVAMMRSEVDGDGSWFGDDVLGTR